MLHLFKNILQKMPKPRQRLKTLSAD